MMRRLRVWWRARRARRQIEEDLLFLEMVEWYWRNGFATPFPKNRLK